MNTKTLETFALLIIEKAMKTFTFTPSKTDIEYFVGSEIDYLGVKRQLGGNAAYTQIFMTNIVDCLCAHYKIRVSSTSTPTAVRAAIPRPAYTAEPEDEVDNESEDDEEFENTLADMRAYRRGDQVF